MFNPIIGVLITGASRLMLEMAESFVARKKGYLAFCDTDSMAINPELGLEVQAFFSFLNPYRFDDDLLKIEDENYKNCKHCEGGRKTKDCTHLEKAPVDPFKQPLLFYGVSAKRYVLYRKRGSRISIIKNSARYRLPPKSDGKQGRRLA